MLITSLSTAQSYYFDNYSVNNGLAQSTAYSIIQDNKGFIWIGNGSGVSRFDGTDFFNYTSADGISVNGVRAILQDSSGNIWLGHTAGGVSLFDGHDFYRLEIDSNKLNLTSLILRRMLKETYGYQPREMEYT